MGGYEEAARFVLADADGQSAPTVLYSASVDTGVFVFFVRKHDPARRLVVLRSDKLLTTSLMGQAERRRSHPAVPRRSIPCSNRYGTRFIVIEDMPSGSIVLDWLRDELRGDRFIERRRIAVDPVRLLSRRSVTGRLRIQRRAAAGSRRGDRLEAPFDRTRNPRTACRLFAPP